jgi:hypothetical protein
MAKKCRNSSNWTVKSSHILRSSVDPAHPVLAPPVALLPYEDTVSASALIGSRIGNRMVPFICIELPY